MKKIKLFCVLILVGAFSLSCAHNHSIVGSEQKSEIPEGVRVKIGSPEVSEGDTVDILKKTCPGPRLKAGSKFNPHDHDCVTKKVGSSKVIKILTTDTAIITEPAGLKIESDMTVEKSESK